MNYVPVVDKLPFCCRVQGEVQDWARWEYVNRNDPEQTEVWRCTVCARLVAVLGYAGPKTLDYEHNRLFAKAGSVVVAELQEAKNAGQ